MNMGVAGVNFAIRSNDPIVLAETPPEYTSFIGKAATDNSSTTLDICLELDGIPDIENMVKIFDSGQSWTMFRDREDYVIQFKPPSFRKAMWAARFDPVATRVTVYCDRTYADYKDGKTILSNPITYPLDQLLTIFVLAEREGALIHAAGIDIHGKGLIFPGRSGAGKSTLSRQFLLKAKNDILSDDRIVVRKFQDVFRIFGTPWPGEAGIAINNSLPLYGLFFIRHGTKNIIKEVKPSDAFESLLPVTSIPWYDERIMSSILVFCEDLITHIPAYELHFTPGIEVADLIDEFTLSGTAHGIS